jgi:hypothetical protein
MLDDTHSKAVDVLADFRVLMSLSNGDIEGQFEERTGHTFDADLIALDALAGEPSAVLREGGIPPYTDDRGDLQEAWQQGYAANQRAEQRIRDEERERWREALEQALDRMERVWEHLGLNQSDNDREIVAQELWFGKEEARELLEGAPNAD